MPLSELAPNVFFSAQVYCIYVYVYVYHVTSISAPTSHYVDDRFRSSEMHRSLSLLGPLQSTRLRGVRLDILALGEGRPQLAEEGPVVTMVQVSEQRLDGLGCLLSMVEGDSPVVSAGSATPFSL